LCEHVLHTLDCKEAIGVYFLANAFKEDGKVVVEVKLHYRHFPVDSVLRSMVNCNGEVTSIIKKTEVIGFHKARLYGSSYRGSEL